MFRSLPALGMRPFARFAQIVRLGLFVAFVLVCGCAEAIPYQIGSCTVEIEIRSRAMIPILQHWVTVKETADGGILVIARADGYETRKVRIPQVGGQTLYRLDLVLEDSPRHVIVRDTSGKVFSSTYVDLTQFGYPSDAFGITVCIPKKMCPKPNLRMVQVMSDLLWTPIMRSCQIEEIEGFQRLRIEVDRRDYGATQRLVSVLLDLPKIEDTEDDQEEEGEMGTETAETWLKRLHHLEGFSGDSAATLAGYVFNAYSAEELQQSMSASGIYPETLNRLLQQRGIFRSLHRE